MILIRETDSVTESRVPRRHTGGRPIVVVTSFADGERCGTEEYTFEEWAAVYPKLLAAGFRMEDSTPDVRIVIDTDALTLRIAGGQPLPLVEPGTLADEHDEDGAEPLIDQADTALYEAGYLRTTSWLTDSTGNSGRLVAVATPTVRSEVPIDMIGVARAVLTPAVAALRYQVEPHVEDWLVLCEDVLSAGLHTEVLAMQRRRIREANGHATPARTDGVVCAAIEPLYAALVAARAGHVTTMVEQAAKVPLVLAGIR